MVAPHSQIFVRLFRPLQCMEMHRQFYNQESGKRDVTYAGKDTCNTFAGVDMAAT